MKRGGSLRKLQGCQQPRFQPSFSDFQTLNPTSDIINVYSDVLKIRIFFVSGTVKWLSIIVYLEDAWLAALNFVPLNDCVIQTFTIGYPRLFPYCNTIIFWCRQRNYPRCADKADHVNHGGHGDISHRTFEDIKDKYHRHDSHGLPYPHIWGNYAVYIKRW